MRGGGSTGRSLRREQGETLIEVLVATVILSIGVIGIAGSIANGVSAANRMRGRADISQVITQVADVIQRASWECDPLAAVATLYQGASAPLPATLLRSLLPSTSWTIVVTEVSHWGKSREFEPNCPPEFEELGPPAVPTNEVFKTLKLKIAVTAPGNRGTRTVELVKRNDY